MQIKIDIAISIPFSIKDGITSKEYLSKMCFSYNNVSLQN